MQDTRTVINWLRSLPEGSDVGIDEGGLCLRAVLDDELTGDYYEIGGIPQEIEDDWCLECDRPNDDCVCENIVRPLEVPHA